METRSYYSAEVSRDGVSVRVEVSITPASRYRDEDETGEVVQRAATRTINEMRPRGDAPF